MSISPAALVIAVVALLGGALALAAFAWAVRRGHLDPGDAGASVIFDEDERK